MSNISWSKASHFICYYLSMARDKCIFAVFLYHLDGIHDLIMQFKGVRVCQIRRFCHVQTD